MKKSLLLILVLLVLMSFTTACSKSADNLSKTLTADCNNGNFVGKKLDNGVLSFKGIPFAKPAVGDLRWKAPEAPDDSDKTYNAFDFGNSSLQYEWFSEPASSNKIGEDCLTLNVWTSGSDPHKKKPVMVFIHGGGFAWGGTSDPLYDGQYFVEKNKDIVMVTCNYRVGMMGLIDFSKVPGGEAFPDSANLSTLDQIAALKWIQSNIEAFGGDPGNVTIFGESAGGAFTSLLLASKQADGLFQKCIAQSGGYALTYSQATVDKTGLTDALLKVTGATNMDELMAIPEEKLKEYYFTPLDDTGTCLNDMYNMPLRDGTLIPEDPYQAISDGQGKNVTLMIGSNADEWKYWIDEMNTGSEESNLDAYAAWMNDWFDRDYSLYTTQEKALADKFMALQNSTDHVANVTEFFNDLFYRIPATETAVRHANAGGTSYVYYWNHPSTKPGRGACHASELSYVFHNTGNTMFSGTVDEKLADKVCTAWANFARTGNPSIEGVKWAPYTSKDRATMVITDDLKMENDVLSEQRVLAEPFLKYYLKDIPE